MPTNNIEFSDSTTPVIFSGNGPGFGNGNGNPPWADNPLCQPGFGHGHGNPPWCEPPAVPEPTTWVLIVMGLLLALIWKHHKSFRSRNVKVHINDLYR